MQVNVIKDQPKREAVVGIYLGVKKLHGFGEQTGMDLNPCSSTLLLCDLR